MFFFTSVGRIHREVRHGYTNSGGLKNRRSTKVKRSTKKTQFEVERSTPEAFLLLEMESADCEFKEYKDGMAYVTKNAGWLAAAQDRKRWKREKKAKHFFADWEKAR